MLNGVKPKILFSPRSDFPLIYASYSPFIGILLEEYERLLTLIIFENLQFHENFHISFQFNFNEKSLCLCRKRESSQLVRSAEDEVLCRSVEYSDWC